MGYFGYRFINLTPEEHTERRVRLDQYANLAQFSQAFVLLVLLVVRAVLYGLKLPAQQPLEDRPSSPQRKYLVENGRWQWTPSLLRAVRQVQWKLGNEIFPGYGTVGQWLGGALWSAWLAFLTIANTAPGKLSWFVTYVVTFTNICRLHAPNQALWYHCRITASAALPPCRKNTLFSYTASAPGIT